ncbi:hypothetical protein C8Q76DRAFT_771463 [Earliella scabrosa]|nr:hypothetical protein C8Q76DRAFT_771463 [Earliella scabrosa]
MARFPPAPPGTEGAPTSIPPPHPGAQHMTLRTSSANSRPSEIQRHTKPKRLKAHTVITKRSSIPTVPRDRIGKPILPLNVGIMTGAFHTERYIFPVGYEVTRRYFSTVDPNSEVVYHCEFPDANHIRNRAHSNSVSGPDFFGLGQNTIKHLIQELPYANQLKDYVWQHFG